MPENDKNNQKEEPSKTPTDNLVETKHSVTINGKEILYTVTTGTIVLKEETEGKGENAGKSEGERPKATIFFIAYTMDDVEDQTRRPLTFSFNGGPGSSSVWMHLGLLGPRRVLMDEEGYQLQPPYKLVNNEYSLLDKTDLVFIDPVSTGYSRAVEGESAKEFHGFKKDIESVGDFIRLYTTRYKRWKSPKFLIGESYGTTRASGLSGYLLQRHRMYLNGIMLISAVLDFQTILFTTGNELPYMLFLPGYTAAAWYHKKLSEDLQKDLRKTLKEASEFAMGEYALALLKGAALQQQERAAIVSKMARYTGLSEDYVDKADLRVRAHRFFKELLREERRTIGRLDSRFKGIDRDSAGEFYEYDPMMAHIDGTYTATFYDYVREDLEYEIDLPYEVLNYQVNPQWSYADHQNQYVNVAETLRKAITMNPFMKIFIANGYYDLGTPFLATEYTFNHLGLDTTLQSNISMAYYEAGHMMYMHIPSLAKLKEDLSGFIDSAIPD